MVKPTKSQLEKIKNYEKEYKTITEYKEAVRMKPGQYIGPVGSLGFLNMIREILQNSFDEIVKGNSIDKIIYFYYDEVEHKVSIQDSGRGIPFNKLIDAFHSEHTSTNFENKKGVYSSGNHGEGAKVTNVLSSYFSVESHILGEGRKVEFNNFEVTNKGIQKVKVTKDDFQQGTRVTFIPCYYDKNNTRRVMGKIDIKIPDVINLINRLIYLCPIGTTVLFTGKKTSGDLYNETIINKNGLLHYIETQSPLIKPISLFDDNGTTMARIIFTFDSNNLQGEQIRAFANFCPANGTHIDGTMDGICRYFRNYMNKIYLNASNKNKKEKLSVLNSDVKTGLRLVVSAAHIDPIFTGQAKETLSNDDMYYFTKNLVIKGLEEWSKDNSKNLNYVCSYLKGIAEIRVKADKGKTKLSNNYKKSALSDYPAKYKEPILKEHLELVIVEGDSAAGSAKMSRTKNQGIMPIKGKIPNAFSTIESAFIKNEEISGLIMIIGNGDEKNYGKHFDINKVPFEKIIIMPDADPDGAHIRTLVLGFFILYMPELIQKGFVYAAVPPLFGMKINGKMKYFIERKDYVDYIEKLFIKNNTVKDMNGNKLTNKDISEIFYFNEEYSYDLDKVSHYHAIDPYALELLLIHWKESLEKKIRIIKKNFRFADFRNVNGTTILCGNINRRIHNVFFTRQFISDCQKLYDKYISYNKSMYYVLNDKVESLYTFIKAYNDAKPKKNFTRYKGLGEMNETQLAESTLISGQRTLIQYTMESANEEIERAKYLNKNKREFIKEIKEARLVDLIG